MRLPFTNSVSGKIITKQLIYADRQLKKPDQTKKVAIIDSLHSCRYLRIGNVANHNVINGE